MLNQLLFNGKVKIMNIYVNILVILLFTKYALNNFPGIKKETVNKTFIFISTVILALLTGLRDKHTGPDTINYGNNFLLMRKCSTFSYAISEKTGRFEIGYKIWVKLIGYITDNVNVFFTITAFFIAILVAVYIYRNSKNPFFSMILYYTGGMYAFQMTGLRQAMSMAIGLLRFKFVK